MQDYRNLQVWAKAHDLALAVYRATDSFPSREMYGLTSQIRRCAVSVPSNIVEGCGRDGQAEMLRFLRYSLGSANELEYQLVLSRDLGFLDVRSGESLGRDVTEVKMMLTALIRRLQSAMKR